MTDRIILENVQLHGRHGVSDEERASPQPFEVDVELFADLAPAGASDDRAETIDYSDVYGRIRRIVETENHRLLETIAERIAAEILGAFAVDEVRVRVYENTAVETGLSTMVGQDKGKAVPRDTRFTRVWVKQEGRWRLVANHYSLRITQQ